MAQIVRHPSVRDYIQEMSLAQIEARGGIADRFEQGNLILISDFRHEIDFDALEALQKSTDHVADRDARRQLKKVQATTFFEGEEPSRRSRFLPGSGPALEFSDPRRQLVFDILCKGDPDIFERASRALKSVHDQMLRLFGIMFPGYHPFRFIPSVRLTRTLFENLHWDNHSIDDDFQQARLFTNLDRRPRIWHISHLSDEYARQIYDEHDLDRFAGKDPNQLLDYITGDLFGGTRNTWMENMPKHKVAFEPGEVWSGESRLISHQIYYGESAMVYMWFMKVSDMVDPNQRFNNRIDALHRSMAARNIPAEQPADT